MGTVRRRILFFLLFAFGISWAIATAGVALGATPQRPLAYTLMATLFMFGPAAAAIIMQRMIDRRPWTGLGIGLKEVRWGQMGWTAVVGLLVVPVALLVAKVLGDGFGIGSFGHVSITQEHMVASIEQAAKAQGASAGMVGGALQSVPLPGGCWLLIFQVVALLVACTVNLPVMMGEELGWRGYLYHVMEAWPGYRRVLVTGVAWGLWHAPLIALGHNYPAYPVIGIFLMVVFCVLLALLFDRARTRARTTWAAGLLHGCINGSAGGYMLFAWEGHPLVNSPVGLAGFLALGLLGVMVLVLDHEYRAAFMGRTTDRPVAAPLA